MSAKANALASFRAALRRADADGVLVLNVASAAGLLLHINDGEAAEAAGMLSPEDGEFARRVANAIDQIELNDVVESSERLRRRVWAGSGG